MPGTLPIPAELILPTLADLVKVPSVNPGFSGGTGEAEAAVYCAACLREAGLEVVVQEVAPGRPNVVGRLKGSGGGPTLMFQGHLDTEGPQDMTDPFVVRRHDGRLIGRGSADMKAGLATMLWAAMILAETGVTLKGDLLVACVADMKVGGLGLQALLERYRPDAAIVCQSTELAVGWCHPGYSCLEVELRRSRGSNPITLASRVVAAVAEQDRALSGRGVEELVPSFRPVAVFGAAEWGNPPRTCRLRLERRFLPSETEAVIQPETAAILQALARADPGFRARLFSAPGAARPAFRHRPDSPFLALVEATLARVTDRPARRLALPTWTEAALLQQQRIPTLVLGPEGRASEDEESVREDSLGLTAEVLVDLAIAYCQLA